MANILAEYPALEIDVESINFHMRKHVRNFSQSAHNFAQHLAIQRRS